MPGKRKSRQFEENIYLNFTSSEVYSEALRQLDILRQQQSHPPAKNENDQQLKRVVFRMPLDFSEIPLPSIEKINSLDPETRELHNKIGKLLMEFEENPEREKRNITEYTINSIWDFWKLYGQPEKKAFLYEAEKLKNIIYDIYKDNSILYKISPFDFEKIIAQLLEHQGFKVDLTKQTRDGGYDILALRFLDNHNPLKFLVECKRFVEHKGVNVEIVRSFKEVVQSEQANRGLIVTTSYFTSDAKKKQAETPYLLDFKDKENVVSWIKAFSLK